MLKSHTGLGRSPERTLSRVGMRAALTLNCPEWDISPPPGGRHVTPRELTAEPVLDRFSDPLAQCLLPSPLPSASQPAQRRTLCPGLFFPTPARGAGGRGSGAEEAGIGATPGQMVRLPKCNHLVVNGHHQGSKEGQLPPESNRAAVPIPAPKRVPLPPCTRGGPGRSRKLGRASWRRQSSSWALEGLRPVPVFLPVLGCAHG